MLPFGKISQMTRTIVQKSHACANVPLTTVFDCASPNSHINNLLNQLNYFNHEEIKRKQQIKQEKAKRLKAKYKLTLLPDYSKKNETNKGTETETAIARYQPSIYPSVRTLEYFTTDTNRRISPEFLELLRKQEPRAIERIEPIKRLRTIPNQYGLCNNDDSRHWEQVNPGLAKYLRDSMERNDIMSKIYNINFYDNPNPQNLKYILMALNQKGIRALSQLQLAKLNKFLVMSSQQSPEEFERQLGYLKSDGFLNREMVQYTQMLLELNNGEISNERMRKHLAALRKVDSYEQGGGGELSLFRFGGESQNKRRNAFMRQNSSHWNTLAVQNGENWNASPGNKGGLWGTAMSRNFLNENNGMQYTGKGVGRGGYQYSYDYLQNTRQTGGSRKGKSYGYDNQSGRGLKSGSTTSKTNRYRYGGTEAAILQNHDQRSREKVFQVKNSSFSKPEDMFGEHGKPKSSFNELDNQRKSEVYEKQYLKLLYGPNRTKSRQDKDNLSEKKSQYYVRRPWERTPNPLTKEYSKGITSEEAIEYEPIQYPGNAFKNIRLKLKFNSRLKKSQKHQFPDRTGKSLPMPERFAADGYFRPRKYVRKIRSSDGIVQTNAVSFIVHKEPIRKRTKP